MKEKLIDKLYELKRRASDCGIGYENVTINHIMIEDGVYTITNGSILSESVDIEIEDSDRGIMGFPLAALNDELIEQVLDSFEEVIEDKENEIEKVFDNNYYASL